MPEHEYPTTLDAVVRALPQLVTEDQAYETFGHLLQAKERRRARQEHRIGFYKRKKTIFYRVDELSRFLNERLAESYQPCDPVPSSNSDHTGSAGLPDQPNCIGSGMTPELEKSAADLLRQQLSKPPRSRSPRSASKAVSDMPPDSRDPA